MIINEPGTYTLRYTATDDCGKTSNVDRELVVNRVVPIYGIRSPYANSSVCERIGASALLADPVPQHSDGNGGWVGGSSPFDNIYPWSDMEIVEDATAGTLVSIPKYWYRWTRNGEEMILEIAPEEVDGFFVSPAHADRGDGVGERDVVYVGRYQNASDYKSKPNVEPKRQLTRATFRTNIHALGSDIWQFDFAMYWTIAMLYLVEFADWDSQKMIGGGRGDDMYTGHTDGMTYHTGTTNTQVGAEYYGFTQYRHIEGLWSSTYFFCDGIYLNNLDAYAIKNPSDFNDTQGGTFVGGMISPSGANNYIKAFTVPPIGFEYALLPADAGEINNSRTHDSMTATNGSVVVYVGGNIAQNQQAGLFYIGSGDEGYVAIPVGSRLMKLPNA